MHISLGPMVNGGFANNMEIPDYSVGPRHLVQLSLRQTLAFSQANVLLVSKSASGVIRSRATGAEKYDSGLGQEL